MVLHAPIVIRDILSIIQYVNIHAQEIHFGVQIPMIANNVITNVQIVIIF